MRLSLLIATRKRPELLSETLASFARCEPGPQEVLVVDGDEQGSAEPVVVDFERRGGAPAVRYLRSAPGLPVQRNRGLDAATGDVVVFADDDVEADRRLFAVLARAYDDPSIVGATVRIVEEGARRFGNARSLARRLLPGGGQEGEMTRFGYPRRLRDIESERDVEFMEGALMSARREPARELRFDERLPGYALAEDEDFSYRLSRVGRLRYLPQAVVHHRNVGFRSMGTRDFNRRIVVNRAYLFHKNFRRTPLARLQFALLVVVLAGHRVLNGEWSGLVGLAEGSLEAWRSRR